MNVIEVEGYLSIPENHPAHGLWARRTGEVGRKVGRPWHAIERWVVNITLNDGGGSSSVRAEALCGRRLAVAALTMRNDMPPSAMCCPHCLDHIEAI